MLGVSMLVLEEKANLKVYARPAVKGICKSHSKKEINKIYLVNAWCSGWQ